MSGAGDLNGTTGRDLKFAATFLGISPHTVRALARRKALAHFRIGRRLVFKEADLAAFLSRHRVEARTTLPYPAQPTRSRAVAGGSRNAPAD